MISLTEVPSDVESSWALASIAGWEEFWVGSALVDARSIATPLDSLGSDVGSIGSGDVLEVLLVLGKSSSEISGNRLTENMGVVFSMVSVSLKTFKNFLLLSWWEVLESGFTVPFYGTFSFEEVLCLISWVSSKASCEVSDLAGLSWQEEFVESLELVDGNSIGSSSVGSDLVFSVDSGLFNGLFNSLTVWAFSGLLGPSVVFRTGLSKSSSIGGDPNVTFWNSWAWSVSDSLVNILLSSFLGLLLW